MKNATIRQLQIFTVAATQLSFARTAEKLYLTNAGVSLQIKQLEEVAGIALFERIGRRVFLTEAGEMLLKRSREILESLAAADEALSELKGLKGGRIAVAVTSTAECFVPGLLAEFRKCHPDVKVRLLIVNRETLGKHLANNEIDLAIMGRPPGELDYTAASFALNPLVFVAATDHPLATREKVSMEDLASEGFIQRELGSGTRAVMEEFFAEHRIRPRILMELSSNEAIKQSVAANLGLGFVSRHALAQELLLDRVSILKVEGTPVIRRWNLVRHTSKQLTPALKAFWEFMLEAAPGYLELDAQTAPRPPAR